MLKRLRPSSCPLLWFKITLSRYFRLQLSQFMDDSFLKGGMMRKERRGAVTCSKTLSSLFAADRENGNYFRLPRVCLNNAIIKKNNPKKHIGKPFSLFLIFPRFAWQAKNIGRNHESAICQNKCSFFRAVDPFTPLFSH